jgi:hypothetical protein
LALRLALEKGIDRINGVPMQKIGIAQSSFGLGNDVALMITPIGNAGAWKSVLSNPSPYNLIGLGGSYYGGTYGTYNNSKSVLDAIRK